MVLLLSHHILLLLLLLACMPSISSGHMLVHLHNLALQWPCLVVPTAVNFLYFLFIFSVRRIKQLLLTQRCH